MIIYGTTHLKGNLSGFEIIQKCSNCKQIAVFREREIKQFGHIYWIPIIPMGKQMALECAKCETRYVMNENISEAYANSQSRFCIHADIPENSPGNTILRSTLLDLTNWSENEIVEFLIKNKEINFQNLNLKQAYEIGSKLNQVLPSSCLIIQGTEKKYSLPNLPNHYRVEVINIRELLTNAPALEYFARVTKWENSTIFEFIKKYNSAKINKNTYEEACAMADNFSQLGMETILVDETIDMCIPKPKDSIFYNQVKFITYLCRFSIETSRADGPVKKSELISIFSFLSTVLRLSEAIMVVVSEMLDQAVQQPIPLSKLCEDWKNTFDKEASLILLSMLYAVAYEDGKISKEELFLINSIANMLGIEENEHKSVRSEFIKEDMNVHWYSVLGLNPGATREEIKKAYRVLSMMYHPDKVAHLGPEFVKVAEERFKNINEAYTRLTKE